MRHPISTLRPTAYSASLCALLACLVLVIPALGAAQSNTLSLDQAIALALESHPALTSADYSIAAGVARQDQVESGLRPSVDLTSGWTARVSGSEEFGGAPIEPGRDSSPFSSDLTVGIQARQLLTDFGRTANRMDAARMSTDVSTLDRASLEISIVEDVRLAYFALVAAESLTRVAEDSLERERLRFVQVEAFVNEGIRAPIELAQSRASVASAELSVMEAQGDVDNALLVLADAIGVRPGAFDSVEPGFRAPTSLESMTPDERAGSVRLGASPRLRRHGPHPRQARPRSANHAARSPPNIVRSRQREHHVRPLRHRLMVGQRRPLILVVAVLRRRTACP